MTTIPEPAPVTLSIRPDKLVFIIERAKEFGAKDAVTEPDPGSNPSDDGMIEVLEDHADDPSLEELVGAIDGMTYDEQVDLVALAWLGRDDYTAEDWSEVRADAEAAHNDRTGRYLAAMPLLADYLEEGLEALGFPVSDLESENI